MNPLWQLDNIALGQRLRGINLRIGAGVTAVLGPSGAGKTSLLNLLVGFEKPSGGKLSAQVGKLYWVPPDDGLWPHLTVLEHLQVVRPTAGRELLAEFDLEHQANDRPATLSRGERARLAVARALASEAAVLVMDEPLAHVAPAHLGKYWDAIRRYLARSNAALLFATHAPATVLAEAQQVICLRNAQLLYAGSVDELYWRPPTAELADCFGESNWLEPAEADRWLGRTEMAARCWRPEQVSVQPQPDGPLVVESSRFGGAIAEVELREPASGAVRKFYHRPAFNHLAQGTRVILKALICLMLLAGCGPKEDSALAIRQLRVWPIPPVGTSQPAPRTVSTGWSNEWVVLDTAGRVLVYDQTGLLNRQWPMPESIVGKPEGVCVLRDGRVLVCDTHYHRVVVFSPSGEVLKMFGQDGRGPGEFIYPVAITTDADENLYIGEYGSNDRVQKFNREGQYLLSFGSFGTGPGQFQRPSGIVWDNGQVYVADAFNNRIQQFTETGQYVRTLGPVTLHFPYDLRLGADGLFYVIEYGGARVSQLNRDGKLLGRFGSSGRGPGQLATPWGLAVANGRIVVADTGNRRLVELVR